MLSNIGLRYSMSNGNSVISNQQYRQTEKISSQNHQSLKLGSWPVYLNTFMKIYKHTLFFCYLNHRFKIHRWIWWATNVNFKSLHFNPSLLYYWFSLWLWILNVAFSKLHNFNNWSTLWLWILDAGFSQTSDP